MEPAPERILANLREVKDRMAAAAARSGRAAEAVRLVAVTKTVGTDAIRLLVAAGQREFGESRPQQLRDRAAELTDLAIAWHMIGPLQRNKVKYVVPTAAMIHSVDSLALAEEISRRATASSPLSPPRERGRGEGGQSVDRIASPRSPPPGATGGLSASVAGDPHHLQAAVPFEPAADPSRRSAAKPEAAGDARKRKEFSAACLLEINSGESQKGGVSPSDALQVAAAIAALPGINLVGLMTMAPLSDDPESARPAFAALHKLLDHISRAAALPCPLTELSMGMTQDYEVAIEEGATIVRVGTALFS